MIVEPLAAARTSDAALSPREQPRRSRVPRLGSDRRADGTVGGHAPSNRSMTKTKRKPELLVRLAALAPLIEAISQLVRALGL